MTQLHCRCPVFLPPYHSQRHGLVANGVFALGMSFPTSTLYASNSPMPECASLWSVGEPSVIYRSKFPVAYLALDPDHHANCILFGQVQTS